MIRCPLVTRSIEPVVSHLDVRIGFFFADHSKQCSCNGDSIAFVVYIWLIINFAERYAGSRLPGKLPAVMPPLFIENGTSLWRTSGKLAESRKFVWSNLPKKKKKKKLCPRWMK